MCADDNKWYIGNILEVSKEFGDVFLYFMKTRKSFTWPSKKDQCWVPTVNVICIITTFFKMLKNLKILVDLKI